ncbi:PTS system mannose/fructose/sorbose family IIC subunit, partial [Listeria ivanovii FSL F6-596]
GVLGLVAAIIYIQLNPKYQLKAAIEQYGGGGGGRQADDLDDDLDD